MLSQIAVIALSAVAASNASPLLARQATTSTAALNVTGAPNVTAPVPTATVNATGTASVVPPTPSVITGNQSYPAYPCPAGYLLTYVERNVTLPVPVARARTLFGNWSTSPIFPNVTNANGTGIGSSHTLNLQGVAINEVLVNTTLDNSTGTRRYIWNLTNGPVSALGVSVSNYSSVLTLYNPAAPATSNTTVVSLYTNFCASSQPLGMQLVMTLSQLELATLQRLAGGNATTPAGPTTVASPSVAPTSVLSTVSSRLANATNITLAPGPVVTSAASGVSGVSTLLTASTSVSV